MPNFTGKVVRVIYSKPETSFFILKMKLDEKTKSETPFTTTDFLTENLVTVKGTVPGFDVEAGSWFGFVGKWVVDARYGKQLNITKAPIFPSKLSSGVVCDLLRGTVDKMVLWKLSASFGEDLSEALEDVSKVREELGVSEFDAEFLVSKWLEVKARFRVFNIVASLDLPKTKSRAIWDTFGANTERVLTETPYRLIEVPGISLQTMDTLASRFDISKTSEDRSKAVVLYTIREHLPQGDLYMDPVQLMGRIRQVDPIPEVEVVANLKKVLQADELILDGRTKKGVKAIYLPWTYQNEEVSAQNLASRLLDTVEKDDWMSLRDVGEKTEAVFEDQNSTVEDVIHSAIGECAEKLGFTLSEGQWSALFNALRYRISVTTGLPGTGKSTSMKVLVEILRRSHTSMLLMAPTGIAAKRLGSLTSEQAYTIHRGLGAQGGDREEERESVYAGVVGSKAKAGFALQGKHGGWTHNSESPHAANFVIVDESSMIDQELLTRILDGCSPHAHIVFVGDAAQLPSVGPGNVLRAIIRSEVVPVTHLTQIFRQADTSDIVTAAHNIFNGVVPQANPRSDFALLEEESASKVVSLILRLVSKLYARASTWDGTGSPPTFQVLSPRHAGDVGVTNLNVQIRDIVNPAQPGVPEMKLQTGVIRAEDRVMVMVNDYEKDVYNGDIGKVVSINFKAKQVLVKIHGDSRIVSFTVGEAMRSLRLAYACTVHKYQGLEVDTVVMPCLSSFGRQLQRNLLYTAITRAKKRVILVGEKRALAKAVRNDKEDARKTLFGARLANTYREMVELNEQGRGEVSDSADSERDASD